MLRQIGHRVGFSHPRYKWPNGGTALGDRVIQSLKPRLAHLSANRLPFFSSPVTGNPCNDSGRHRICRSAVSTTRAIHQSVAPLPPWSVLRPRTALQLTKYYVAASENTADACVRLPTRRCPRARVRVRTIARSSIDPKRIRGKRARRWINTKTSVTHDQAPNPPLPFPPASRSHNHHPLAAVAFMLLHFFCFLHFSFLLFFLFCYVFLSIFLSCTQRFVRDAYIGIVYILQDVHLDQ